jgi:signal transduction histidine kinase
MRYPSKVGLLLVLVAVVPVIAGGLVSARLSRRVLEGEVLGLQRELAQSAASHADDWFAGIPQDLKRAASYLPFDRVTPAEQQALLRVLYRQLDYVTALVLVDGTGKALCDPVFLDATDKARIPAELASRYKLRPKDVEQLSRHIPVKLARKQGLAFGPPYEAADGTRRIVCAVALAGSTPRVLAAEVSLAGVHQILARVAARGFAASLVDRAGGRVLVTTSVHGLAVRPPLKGAPPEIHRYRIDGEEQLATVARVHTLGWGVLLEQSTARALGPVLHLGWYTMGWTALCLALAVAGGVYISRGVTRPVGVLARAARTIEKGDYDLHVEPPSGDELGQLARAFNDMAAAITKHRDELEQLNAELQQRVEERTRQVHDALEQVIRSQKLGAVGELSAGIAHELNNPLTGILGMSQLVQSSLEKDDERWDFLQDVIDQARRMNEIIDGMRRFAESPEDAQRVPLDVERVCRETLELGTGSLREANVEAECHIAKDLPRVRGSAPDLQQALLHLIYNAIGAMPDGGRLELNATTVEGAVCIAVKDTGVGIPEAALAKVFEPFYAPNKAKTRRPGLGLSVVDRIVREHDGQIGVQSREGEGTEFSIYLPGLREEFHLR